MRRASARPLATARPMRRPVKEPGPRATARASIGTPSAHCAAAYPEWPGSAQPCGVRGPARFLRRSPGSHCTAIVRSDWVEVSMASSILPSKRLVAEFCHNFFVADVPRAKRPCRVVPPQYSVISATASAAAARPGCVQPIRPPAGRFQAYYPGRGIPPPWGLPGGRHPGDKAPFHPAGGIRCTARRLGWKRGPASPNLVPDLEPGSFYLRPDHLTGTTGRPAAAMLPRRIPSRRVCSGLRLKNSSEWGLRIGIGTPSVLSAARIAPSLRSVYLRGLYYAHLLGNNLCDAVGRIRMTQPL